MSEQLEFIYIGDVMCSWCWGFTPAIAALQDRFGIPVRLVNGGLRPGDMAEALTPSMERFLEGCWTQVHDASGQPFDHAGLSKPAGWRYDTEPPARAVVTMRALLPERELALYERLQRAFYAENVDVTDPEQWRPLLEGFDVNPDAFITQAASEQAKQAAWADFAQARQWGISGFPALLVRDGDDLVLVAKGWTPTEPLLEGIAEWLQGRGHVQQGASCTPDGCAVP